MIQWILWQSLCWTDHVNGVSQFIKGMYLENFINILDFQNYLVQGTSSRNRVVIVSNPEVEKCSNGVHIMLEKKELVTVSQPANALPSESKTKRELVGPQTKSILGKVNTSKRMRLNLSIYYLTDVSLA